MKTITSDKTEPGGNKKRPFYLRVEEEFSKQKYKYLTEILVVSFFIFVIAGPIVNIISNVVDNIGNIRQRLFFDELDGQSKSIINEFL